MVGELKLGLSISRLKAEMARSGGDLRRHSQTQWCGRRKRGPIGGAHMAAS
jgi:hypothetical protein